MFKFNIVPYVSVGNISFSESRDAVRSKYGTYKEFKKSKSSKNTTDDFSAFHVFYDTDNKVDAVEFFRESSLIYNGENLFDKTYNELKNLFADDANEENESGITFTRLGFSVSSPDKKEIETIIVFKKDYYK